MKILIVDDEPLARRRVVNLLENFDFPITAKESSSGADAIVQINRFKPDLLFLDIDLKDMNGFGVLNQIKIKEKPVVVFISAHDTYAIQAFDALAFDFLLKPFKEERFIDLIERVRSRSKKGASNQFEKKIKDLVEFYSKKTLVEEEPRNKLPIKIGNKTLIIDSSTIHYISASGYYAEIYVTGTNYLIRESLLNLMDLLDPKMFVRVHRSTIININYIQEIIHSDYGQIDVRMKDKKVVSVSKSHKKEVLKRLMLTKKK